MEWAARLYPARWRRRYGAEFGARLDESGGEWRAIADVLKGALAMQMRSWSVWKSMAACGAIGAMIAGAVISRIPKVYESSAVLRTDADDSVAREWLGQMLQNAWSETSLSRLITNVGLYEAERAQRPIEDVVRDMRARTYVSLVASHPAAFKVSYRGSSPAEARRVADLLVSRLIDANWEAREARRVSGPSRLEVLDPATLPQRPRSPKPWALMTLGILLGVLLGVLAFQVAVWSKRSANA